jgi:hypothetical protein
VLPSSRSSTSIAVSSTPRSRPSATTSSS